MKKREMSITIGPDGQVKFEKKGPKNRQFVSVE